jgi:hypothetical protein
MILDVRGLTVDDDSRLVSGRGRIGGRDPTRVDETTDLGLPRYCRGGIEVGDSTALSSYRVAFAFCAALRWLAVAAEEFNG